MRTAEGLASRAEDDALVRAPPVALGHARRLVGLVVVAGQLLVPPVLARGDDVVVGRQRPRWLRRRYGGRGGAQGHDKGGGSHKNARTRSHCWLVCVGECLSGGEEPGMGASQFIGGR